MKRVKRFLSFMLVGAMLLNFAITAYASERVDPRYVGTFTRSYWKHSYAGSHEVAEGNWIHVYTGSPAVRAGETDSVSISIELTHTYSGSFGVNIKDKVQLELGYSYGDAVSFTAQKTSSALAKGEYVKAYYKKNYEVTTVKQVESINAYGWEQESPGGAYAPVDRWEYKTSYVFSKRAILPLIKLEYYTGVRSTEPTSVEVYQYMDGDYQLVK